MLCQILPHYYSTSHHFFFSLSLTSNFENVSLSSVFFPIFLKCQMYLVFFLSLLFLLFLFFSLSLYISIVLILSSPFFSLSLSLSLSLFHPFHVRLHHSSHCIVCSQTHPPPHLFSAAISASSNLPLPLSLFLSLFLFFLSSCVSANIYNKGSCMCLSPFEPYSGGMSTQLSKSR